MIIMIISYPQILGLNCKPITRYKYFFPSFAQIKSKVCRHVLVYRLQKASLNVPLLDNGQIMKADQIYKETSFHRKQNIKFSKNNEWVKCHH